MLYREEIKRLATQSGFDLCGITPCRHLPENHAWYQDWIAHGYHSTLGYMERNADKRFDPRLLMEGARTAVVCAAAYKNRVGEGYPPDHKAKVASYACADDYHDSIRKMLEVLLTSLRELHPGLTGRAYVDTAPLAEKQLAVEAGLGWIGRQSLLITPRFGSYVMLGELLLSDETDTYDEPFEGSRCGRCRNCIDSCPTGAIVAPKMIDTRRCIACHTIEREPLDKIDLDHWIFGCERCQSCCPHNAKAPMYTNPAFTPRFNPIPMTSSDWLSLDDDGFEQLMGRTPLTRSGLERIKSNLRE